MEERKPFERIYHEEQSPKEIRDRFQVEFNDEERKLFIKAQEFILQTKDATALKQLAFLGWYAISNRTRQNAYFRDILLKNKVNNDRQGIDVKTEITNKFQQRILRNGGKR